LDFREGGGREGGGKFTAGFKVDEVSHMVGRSQRGAELAFTLIIILKEG